MPLTEDGLPDNRAEEAFPGSPTSPLVYSPIKNSHSSPRLSQNLDYVSFSAEVRDSQQRRRTI
jgi:hypothetical protein